MANGPLRRVHYSIDFGQHYVGAGDVATEEVANAVSSKIDTGDPAGNIHAPALDLDVPARLIPSSTEGHSHLYIDVECSWLDYVNLLTALARCGVLEEAYVEASIRQGATFLRKPGVLKAAA